VKIEAAFVYQAVGFAREYVSEAVHGVLLKTI
jgi:hypothetical protein